MQSQDMKRDKRSRSTTLQCLLAFAGLSLYLRIGQVVSTKHVACAGESFSFSYLPNTRLATAANGESFLR